MTGHIKGQGRHQATLLAEVLDDFINEKKSSALSMHL